MAEQAVGSRHRIKFPLVLQIQEKKIEDFFIITETQIETNNAFEIFFCLFLLPDSFRIQVRNLLLLLLFNVLIFFFLS